MNATENTPDNNTADRPARVDATLEYIPPVRPARAAKKMPRTTPRARKIRRVFLATWLILSALWLPLQAGHHNIPHVIASYRLHNQYENELQNATGDRTHLRQNWQRAEGYLKTLDPYIFAFVLTGILPSLLLLIGGAWLLRNAR